jgi:hypothetical protein
MNWVFGSDKGLFSMGSKMVERNAGAFSGKVASGFRQKMRPPKEKGKRSAIETNGRND